MSDEQLAQANRRILHVPLAVHAIVPAYNLAQVPELRLSGTTLADIFTGRIKKWNAPAIANDNPGVGLPALDIKVIHSFPTSKGSPDTYVMADYLSKVSADFRTALTASEGGWPVASKRYSGAEGRRDLFGTLLALSGMSGKALFKGASNTHL